MWRERRGDREESEEVRIRASEGGDRRRHMEKATGAQEAEDAGKKEGCSLE